MTSCAKNCLFLLQHRPALWAQWRKSQRSGDGDNSLRMATYLIAGLKLGRQGAVKKRTALAKRAILAALGDQIKVRGR